MRTLTNIALALGADKNHMRGMRGGCQGESHGESRGQHNHS